MFLEIEALMEDLSLLQVNNKNTYGVKHVKYLTFHIKDLTFSITSNELIFMGKPFIWYHHL